MKSKLQGAYEEFEWPFKLCCNVFVSHVKLYTNTKAEQVIGGMSKVGHRSGVAVVQLYISDEISNNSALTAALSCCEHYESLIL